MTKMKSIAIQLCALVATLLTISIGSVTADATYTPILPPSYPLAVRNPYLSGKFFQRWHHSRQHWASTPFRFGLSLTSPPAWLPGNEVANLPSAVAQFWQGQQLTWSVIARIDGKTYSLFGVHVLEMASSPALSPPPISAPHTRLSR